MLYNKGKKEYKVALTHNMMYLITDTKIQRARKEQKKKKKKHEEDACCPDLAPLRHCLRLLCN